MMISSLILMKWRENSGFMHCQTSEIADNKENETHGGQGKSSLPA